MDPMSTLADCAPDACTLPTAERGLRVAEFDDLFRTSAISVTRIGPRRARWSLTPEPDVPARTAHLVARESQCCSFFDFTLRVADGTLTLDVAVTGEQTAVLDGLVDRTRSVMAAR
jgi:hypothetical protein